MILGRVKKDQLRLPINIMKTQIEKSSKILLSILVLMFLLSPLLAQKKKPQANLDRPNIIFILTDDQRWDALGYAGNDIIQTPEMDKLAQEGVYFNSAIVTTPICSASRASIFPAMWHEPRLCESRE